MYQILIVSPDPETSRILELKFELEGYRVHTFMGVKDMKCSEFHGFDCICIFDMVDTSREQMQELKLIFDHVLSKRCLKTAILLPRGLPDLNVRGIISHPDIVLKKPYELSSLVRLINELTGRSAEKQTPTETVARRVKKSPKRVSAKKSKKKTKGACKKKTPSKAKRPKKKISAKRSPKKKIKRKETQKLNKRTKSLR